MASETQSCEFFFQDTLPYENEKPTIFTKSKLLVLMIIIIMIFGIAMIPLYIQTYEKLKSQSKDFSKIMKDIEEIKTNEKILEEEIHCQSEDFTKMMKDIEELKTNEKILEEEIHSRNSFAHFARVGEFGYFQKLEDKMSYEDGQTACHKIHGKIIESDERYKNATKKLYEVGYKYKWTKNEDTLYIEGYDLPFYIGLINDSDNYQKNQWKWSSTGRIMSKDTLGQKDEGEYLLEDSWKSESWKLTSWAKGANSKKLRGNCAFITYEAELKEIDCSSKLTIICEEL